MLKKLLGGLVAVAIVAGVVQIVSTATKSETQVKKVVSKAEVSKNHKLEGFSDNGVWFTFEGSTGTKCRCSGCGCGPCGGCTLCLPRKEGM